MNVDLQNINIKSFYITLALKNKKITFHLNRRDLNTDSHN